MTLYEKLVDTAHNGGFYKIDLNKKYLRIGYEDYIVEGENLKNESLIEFDGNAYEEIERLYIQFKRSVPEYKCRSFFKADDVCELNMYELSFNINRHLAKAMLEGFVLLASLDGKIVWEDDKHWFWQSQVDKDLVILKKWILTD